MAGLVQQLIIFRPSFSRPRLAAVWAEGNQVIGQTGEKGAAGQRQIVGFPAVLHKSEQASGVQTEQAD